MVKHKARERELKLKSLARQGLKYFKPQGIFECEYCGVFINSSKTALAQRHVQTKGHFNKQ